MNWKAAYQTTALMVVVPAIIVVIVSIVGGRTFVIGLFSLAIIGCVIMLWKIIYSALTGDY